MTEENPWVKKPQKASSRPSVDRQPRKKKTKLLEQVTADRNDPETRVTGQEKTNPDPGLVLDAAFWQDIEGLLGIVMRGHHVGKENARSMKCKKQPGYFTTKGLIAETCLRVKQRLDSKTKED